MRQTQKPDVAPPTWGGGLRHACWVVLCLYSAHAWAQTPVPGIYTCVDAKGRKLTSDRKIPECLDREQKLLNPSGTVKAILAPPMSAQAKQALADKTNQEQAEKARLLADKKRNQALWQRYPSAAAHAQARTDAVTLLRQTQHATTVRLLELKTESGKLQEDMAFYASNPANAPTSLQQKTSAVTQAMQAASQELQTVDTELNRLNARFDDEEQRLKPLWSLAGTAAAPTTPTPKR